MKRTVTFILAIVLCLYSVALQGCSDSDNGTGGLSKKSLKASDLSIENFEWETVSSKYNGHDCFVFSLVNNSDYDIIGVEFTYKIRTDVPDDALIVYDEFMKDHEGYIDETDSPRDVILRGTKDVLVSKGEKLTDLRFTVGFQDWVWYDYPTKEQFELMEPKELEIGVVGDDNTYYIAYYSFIDKSWTLDEITVPANTWSKKAIAQTISKPTEAHHIIVKDEEDRFEVRSYGITADAFLQYVEEIKKVGFVGDSASDAYFDGKNGEGYSVTLDYKAKDQRLIIRVKRDL